VAMPIRKTASTFGPNTGLAMRISMNDAPQRADSKTSWTKCLVFKT
jgi:hypothetical protein